MISSFDEWCNIYKKLTYWDLEIDYSGEKSIEQILEMQKDDANKQFFKFVKNNYKSWLYGDNSPLLSHKIIEKKVLPILNSNVPTYFVLIDNLRYDQWKIIEQDIITDYQIIADDMYSSILPTSTQYSRNSIFSGLLPLDIQNQYPHFWKNDQDDGGKNLFEEELLKNLNRLGEDTSYTKITDIDFGRRLLIRSIIY